MRLFGWLRRKKAPVQWEKAKAISWSPEIQKLIDKLYEPKK
jgi:hypothetical protein